MIEFISNVDFRVIIYLYLPSTHARCCGSLYNNISKATKETLVQKLRRQCRE